MNQYTVRDGVGYILIPRKGVAYEVMVDEADLPLVLPYHWNLDWKLYAVYLRKGRMVARMHRLICPSEKPLVTDHIDCNPLNNRRANLRAVSNALNCRNRKSFGTSCIRFKSGRWSVQFNVGDRPRGFGGYATREEAEARAKEVYEARRRGENPPYNVRLGASGQKGICWNNIRRNWTVYAYANGAKTYLGKTSDLQEAKRMVMAAGGHIYGAEIKLYG